MKIRKHKTDLYQHHQGVRERTNEKIIKNIFFSRNLSDKINTQPQIYTKNIINFLITLSKSNRAAPTGG